MSLLASSNHAMQATTSGASRSSSALVEHAVAMGFLASVGLATMGWLCVLVVALWNGASWLFS